MGCIRNKTQSPYYALEVVHDLSPNYFSTLGLFLHSLHPGTLVSLMCLAHAQHTSLSEPLHLFFHGLGSSPSPPWGSHDSFPDFLQSCVQISPFWKPFPDLTSLYKTAPSCHSLCFVSLYGASFFFHLYDCLMQHNLLAYLMSPATRKYTPLK